MRILLDENLSEVVANCLRSAGHDVLSIGPEFKSWRDRDLCDMARAENRVILTLDLDFGDLVFHGKVPPPPGVILIRADATDSAAFGEWLSGTLATRVNWTGHFAVVTPSRIRLRRLPASQGEP